TFQVAPGEIIIIKNDGTLNKIRYWELSTEVDFSISHKVNDESYVEEILSESVQSQLLSDVPLGAFLSGGVDSSLVTFFMKQYRAKPLVFTIGSDSKTHDESERAKQFAEAMGVQQELWKFTAQ